MFQDKIKREKPPYDDAPVSFSPVADVLDSERPVDPLAGNSARLSAAVEGNYIGFSYYMRHSKAFNTGVGLVTCVCVLTVFTLPAGAASIIFKKVNTFTIEGTEEKKHDARLELDTEKRLLLVVDEKRGAEKMTYAAIPYDAVTGLSYSRSAHPRAKSGIALGVVSLGIGLLVGFLAKGKKHWFTIEFEGVADHPENYHYLRLDKGNYRRILQAVEAATGLDVEVLEEE